MEYLETHYWNTENCCMTTTDSMSDYIEYEMPSDWCIKYQDGSQIEVITPELNLIRIDVSGDGDEFSHKAEFTLIE